MKQPFKLSALLRIIVVVLAIILFLVGITAIARQSPRARSKYMITNSVGTRYYTNFYTIEDGCIKFTITQTEIMVHNAEGHEVSICGQYTVIENAKH